MPKDRWIILIAVVSFYFVQFRKNIERPKKLVSSIDAAKAFSILPH